MTRTRTHPTELTDAVAVDDLVVPWVSTDVFAVDRFADALPFLTDFLTHADVRERLDAATIADAVALTYDQMFHTGRQPGTYAVGVDIVAGRGRVTVTTHDYHHHGTTGRDRSTTFTLTENDE